MTPPAPPSILVLSDRRMLRHAMAGHPERPERLAAVIAGIDAGAARSGAVVQHGDAAAVAAEILRLVHPDAHVAALDAAAASGPMWIDGDTYLVPDSMVAARLAAGAAVAAAGAVARGEAAVAFAVVRPPGHHAARERAAGFCFLNNVALAVAALRAWHLAARVAIVDWDVHHGDGTQSIFDGDPEVCYASTHEWPLYPGTGRDTERGSGSAVGTMHNVPLPARSGDAAFVAAWDSHLLPAIEAFHPELILISAGYDAHRADALASLEVTEAGYRSVARLVGGLARRLGHRGVAITLEGGYDLEALAASSAATVEGLLEGLDGSTLG